MGILASILLFFSISFIPIIGAGIVIFTPLPLVYFYYNRGRSVGVVMIVLATVITWWLLRLQGFESEIISFIAFGLSAIVMGECFGRGFGPTGTVGLPTLVLVIVGILSITAGGLGKDQNPWTASKVVIKKQFEDVLTIGLTQLKERQKELQEEAGKGKSGPTLPVDQLGQDIEALTPQDISNIAEILTSVFPGFSITGMVFFSWLNFLVARAIFLAQKRLAPSLRDLKKWRVPDVLIWAAIATGIMIVVPSASLRLLGINAAPVLALIYFFGGLAVLAFWFEKKTVPYLVRTISYILIFSWPFLWVPFIGLGFFDLWFDFRKLKTKEPDEIV